MKVKTPLSARRKLTFSPAPVLLRLLQAFSPGSFQETECSVGSLAVPCPSVGIRLLNSKRQGPRNITLPPSEARKLTFSLGPLGCLAYSVPFPEEVSGKKHILLEILATSPPPVCPRLSGATRKRPRKVKCFLSDGRKMAIFPALPLPPYLTLNLAASRLYLDYICINLDAMLL